MRFVVVTGMSGGGKSTAMKMLEDMGFYCVDNLPVLLIEKFVELIITPNTEYEKVALGLDVRSDQDFAQAEKVLDKLKEDGYVFEILFMDANDKTLLKRYKETRRVHPLSTEENPRIEEKNRPGMIPPMKNRNSTTKAGAQMFCKLNSSPTGV